VVTVQLKKLGWPVHYELATEWAYAKQTVVLFDHRGEVLHHWPAEDVIWLKKSGQVGLTRIQPGYQNETDLVMFRLGENVMKSIT